jgi:hypothetical protein
MLTVKDMYEECISNGYSFMAHTLYYLLREGIVSPDDPAEGIKDEDLDYNAVKDLEAQNYLGFHITRPYSLKIAPGEFIFVFAKNEDEAISFFKKQYGLQALNCHEYPLDFSLMRGSAFITFREIQKEYSIFPAVIGFFSKGDS